MRDTIGWNERERLKVARMERIKTGAGHLEEIGVEEERETDLIALGVGLIARVGEGLLMVNAAVSLAVEISLRAGAGVGLTVLKEVVGLVTGQVDLIAKMIS